ncbi:hypothetical protein SAMN05216228_10787 [Rhizobium tibeticum]|uniref:PH domain-containing protein n=1 Tax=Rhizobium tibeticum TaxID=501024 RepID=A0ABY1AYA1_9HYPH|nr:hypothetical protein SAMN05216228_10787 [Rhizobium tibeticum]
MRDCFCLEFQLDAAAAAKAKWRAALRSCFVGIREAVPPIPEMIQSSYFETSCYADINDACEAGPIQGMRVPPHPAPAEHSFLAA